MSVEVHVEIAADRIIARSTPQWFPGCADMAKEIPGARWNGEQKYWHYPLDFQTCLLLREVYMDMLRIGPNLKRWAREEKSRIESAQEIYAAHDATLHVVPQSAPVIAEAMKSRTYQRVGARFIADVGSCLLADEPTLGKTIQYLAGLHERGIWEGAHLVIAPKSSLEETWRREIEKWTDGVGYVLDGTKDQRRFMIDMFVNSDAPARFLICNAEMVRTKISHYCKKCDAWEDDPGEWEDEHWEEDHKTKPLIYKQDYPELFETEFRSICVDEAHKYLLGIKSAKSKTQAGEGLSRLRLAEDGVKIAVTGTPMKGRAISFWAIFSWLRPDKYSSKWQFADKYLEVEKNVFGSTIGEVRKDREHLLAQELSTIMLRRIKREVQADLPEDVYDDIWVDMEPKQEQQYYDLINEGEMELEKGSLTVTGVLAEFTRQKQWAYGAWRPNDKGKLIPDENSPKFAILVAELAKRGITPHGKDDWLPEEDGFKHIIVSQFTVVLDDIERRFAEMGIETMKITGDVSGKKRSMYVRRWQDKDDPCRILLLNTIAGGQSLTLDAWCDDEWILDETWTRDDLVQVEGRIKNRDVEKRTAVRFFHYIRTRDTIEEDIHSSGLTQDEFQQKILDERRGVYAKGRR